MRQLLLITMLLSSTCLFADRSLLFDGTLSAGRETIVGFPKLQLSYLPEFLSGAYVGISLSPLPFLGGHVGVVFGYEFGDLAFEVAGSETMSLAYFSKDKDVGGDYYAFSITPKICYRLSWLPLSDDDLNNESTRNSYAGVLPFLVLKFGPSLYFVQQYPGGANVHLINNLTPLGIPLNVEVGFGLRI